MSTRLAYGIYTIPEVAMVGPTEQQLTRLAVPYEVGVVPFRELSHVQIVGGRDGLLKVLFHVETLKLLAATSSGRVPPYRSTSATVIDHGGTVNYCGTWCSTTPRSPRGRRPRPWTDSTSSCRAPLRT